MLLRRVIEHVKAQNWTAVTLDFVIVVIGVGFALAAERWISDAQKRTDLAGAESDLRRDLLNIYFNAKERLALSECRKTNLRELGEQLLEAEESWHPINLNDSNVSDERAFAAVLHSPNRGWRSSIWEAELGRGTFNILNVERMQNLSVIFRQSEYAEQLQDEIMEGQSRLGALGQLTEIARADRLRYFEIVAAIDEDSYRLESAAQQLTVRIEEFGFEFNEAERNQMREGFAEENRTAALKYGECRKPVVYPFLDDSNADAIRQ